MLTKNKKDLPYVSVVGNIFEQASSRISHGINGCNVIIPHVCNNVNGFGAGFANDIAHYYPIVKDNFHLLGKKAILGYVQFVTVKEDPVYKYKLVFANMIAQNGIINSKNQRPLNYPALVKCMMTVRQHGLDIMNNNENTKVEIHAPKFGSGLAGGNWYFITDLIEDIWSNNFSVHIYTKK